MDDPFKGRYEKACQFEFDVAQKVLSEFEGKLEWGEHNYQAFIFTGKNLKIVFYPHKTSTTGNRSIKCYGSGKDFKLAHALLKIAIGGRNTFDIKNAGSDWQYQMQIAKQRGLETGYLHEQMKHNYNYHYDNEYSDTVSRRIK